MFTSKNIAYIDTLRLFRRIVPNLPLTLNPYCINHCFNLHITLCRIDDAKHSQDYFNGRMKRNLQVKNILDQYCEV